jgi:exosortase
MSATQATSPSFLVEFQDTWRRVHDKTIFLVLFISWIALFQFLGVSTQSWTGNLSLLSRLWMLYSVPDSDTGFAKLIPPAILFLLWHKRERLAATAAGPRWPALLLLAMALGFHLVGFLAQQESISSVALFLGLYSLVGLAWGSGVMLEAFFPFCLLLFCVPTGSAMETLTFWLRMIATTLTQFVSHDILSVPLVQHGTTLVKPDGNAFEIVAACSGLHSFTALLVITIIYAMVSLHGLGRRALLIGITVPLAVICNVLRLTAMVVADRAFGAKAGHMVHDSDWIFTYGVAIAVIMLLGNFLAEKSPPPAT